MTYVWNLKYYKNELTNEGSRCFKFVIPKGYNNYHSH